MAIRITDDPICFAASRFSVHLLLEFSNMLKAQERSAPIIVVTPFWPRHGGEWYLNLSKLSDKHMRFNSGKLMRIADDAPPRIEGWPLIVFHIPPTRMNAKARRNLVAGLKDGTLEQIASDMEAHGVPARSTAASSAKKV